MSSCPRCGGNKTSRVLRKGTNIEDQWCLDCGWHGVGTRNVVSAIEPKPKAKTPRKPKKKAEPLPVPAQVVEPVLDTQPREDDPCSYLLY